LCARLHLSRAWWVQDEEKKAVRSSLDSLKRGVNLDRPVTHLSLFAKFEPVAVLSFTPPFFSANTLLAYAFCKHGGKVGQTNHLMWLVAFGDVARRLKAERVVGVTLAASGFGCLDEIGFPLVLLDEACQQTESSSLLALARFGVENLVLVGDPMQVGEMHSPSNAYQHPITFHLYQSGD
jgi:hypothetical protein